MAHWEDSRCEDRSKQSRTRYHLIITLQSTSDLGSISCCQSIGCVTDKRDDDWVVVWAHSKAKAEKMDIIFDINRFSRGEVMTAAEFRRQMGLAALADLELKRTSLEINLRKA